MPGWPVAPALVFDYTAACGEDWVCMTVASAIAMGEWIRAAEEYRAATSGCPNVVEETP